MKLIHRAFVQSALSVVALCAAMTPQAHAVAVSGQGTWEATLQARDLDGNLANGAEAYYDTALNITWLGNAGFPMLPMSWDDAMAYASGYNANGIRDWRLTKVVDTGAPGCDRASSGTDCGSSVDPSSSELAHMYFVTLGNSSGAVSPVNEFVTGLTNTGPFAQMVPMANDDRHPSYADWWTGTDLAGSNHDAWYFSGYDGAQLFMDKSFGRYRAWAVHDGDVGTVMSVPEPSSVVLMALGLSGLAVARRRKAQA